MDGGNDSAAEDAESSVEEEEEDSGLEQQPTAEAILPSEAGPSGANAEDTVGTKRKCKPNQCYLCSPQ